MSLILGPFAKWMMRIVANYQPFGAILQQVGKIVSQHRRKIAAQRTT
jgi:hypothetical protein